MKNTLSYPIPDSLNSLVFTVGMMEKDYLVNPEKDHCSFISIATDENREIYVISRVISEQDIKIRLKSSFINENSFTEFQLNQITNKVNQMLIDHLSNHSIEIESLTTVVKAKFTSVWDGNIEFETDCNFDLVCYEVCDIQTSDDDEVGTVEMLEEEYVSISFSGFYFEVEVENDEVTEFGKNSLKKLII